MPERARLGPLGRIGPTARLVLWVLLCAAAAGARAELDLVRDGKPVAAIVTPAEPNAGETRAAQELQAYLKKASGAELPIKTADGGGPRIVLGRACKALRHPPTGDGFAIETHGDTLQIAGGNPRGTLYGAYAFLETQLGIRWFMPGELGEVVPPTKTVRIPKLDTHEQPSFEYRWIGRNNDWTVRNRNNVNVPDDLGITVFRSAHTFRTFLNPDKYFDAHPEWYALVRGERRRNTRTTHGNQICTTNPEAVREVIKNMRAFLDENPDVKVVTLFPNDGNWFCECPRCKALDEPGWATVEEVNRHGRAAGLRGYGTLSRRLMLFDNAVAKALGQSHPGVMVKVGAYSCYTNPPKDKSLRHEPNIIVQICHSWCHNHAITDPRCPVNAAFRKAIEGWSKITPGGVMLYEYYYKVAQCELPFPIIHAMRKDLPYFKRIGVRGVYTQYTTNWGTLTLPYYVAARLLWNVEADVDALLGDFYAKFYGPAAAPMKRYYERLEKAAVDSDLHFSPPYFRFPEVFTEACLRDCQAALDEAKRLADTDKRRQRVAIAQTSLDYTKVVMDYVNAVRAVDARLKGLRWRVEIDPALFDEAAGKAEAVRQFMARPETKGVLRRNTSYVQRLLNPQTTFSRRYDSTDTRQLEQRKAVALTKREWLKTAPKHPLATLPAAFDLWVYAHDLDADDTESEHELRLLDHRGARIAVGPLPPKGQACNRAVGCVVFQGLKWPDERRDVLQLEIVNRPGHWTGSTLLAVYVMPPGLGLTPKKAAEMIRTQPEWPRRQAIGFTECGYRGLLSSDGEPARIDIELIEAAAKQE